MNARIVDHCSFAGHVHRLAEAIADGAREVVADVPDRVAGILSQLRASATDDVLVGA